MQIVDLRDDPRMDMMLSSNIGSAIGQGFAVQQQRKQLDQQKETERKQQEFIVAVLSNNNLSAKEKREVFMNPNSPISQQTREQITQRKMKNLYSQDDQQPDLRQGADGRYYTIQNGQATAVEGMPARPESGGTGGMTQLQALRMLKELGETVKDEDGEDVYKLTQATADVYENQLKRDFPEMYNLWKSGSMSLEAQLDELPGKTVGWWKWQKKNINQQDAIEAYNNYMTMLTEVGHTPEQAKQRARQELERLRSENKGMVVPDIPPQSLPGQQEQPSQQPIPPQHDKSLVQQPKPQEPPHKKLTPFWPKMNDEEKQTAILLVQQGMDVNQIIKALKND